MGLDTKLFKICKNQCNKILKLSVILSVREMFPIENHSVLDREGAFREGETQDNEIDVLIFRIAQGGRAALETLYRQTSSAVYAYALSILKNSSSAEDVMQDTFVSIAQNAAAYSSQGKPMAWIMTITRNTAYMKLQKSDNKNLSLEDYTETDSGQDEYSASDRKIMLKMAMNVLTKEERQIVTLHAVSGLKHREIADITGLPLSTVLTKYKRALEKMKKVLGGDGSDG